MMPRIHPQSGRLEEPMLQADKSGDWIVTVAIPSESDDARPHIVRFTAPHALGLFLRGLVAEHIELRRQVAELTARYEDGKQRFGLSPSLRRLRCGMVGAARHKGRL